MKDLSDEIVGTHFLDEVSEHDQNGEFLESDDDDGRFDKKSEEVRYWLRRALERCDVRAKHVLENLARRADEQARNPPRFPKGDAKARRAKLLIADVSGILSLHLGKASSAAVSTIVSVALDHDVSPEAVRMAWSRQRKRRAARSE